MNKREQNINLMADTLDECAMMYYDATNNDEYENSDVFDYKNEKLHTNYYECLLKVSDFFLDENKKLGLYNEDTEKAISDKLDALEQVINEDGMSKEDVRQALLLLDIKGFKNLNFDLDLITPDAISLIFSMLIKNIYGNEKSEITIFDPNIGVGNLVFHIALAYPNELKIFGMDSHSLMARVCAMKANLIQTEAEIYYEDALLGVPTDLSLIVSDLAVYDYENENCENELYKKGVRYFPYLLINHLLHIEKKVLFFYLIDATFFSQKGSKEFKESLKDLGNILALISLPANFFSNDKYQKAILVLDNNRDNLSENLEIYSLPSVSDKANFLKVMNDITEHLKRFK